MMFSKAWISPVKKDNPLGSIVWFKYLLYNILQEWRVSRDVIFLNKKTNEE